MGDLLKKFEDIVNSYFKDDAVEKINDKLRLSRDEYHQWLDTVNKGHDEKRAELQKQFEQIRNLETQMSELGKRIKTFQPDRQNAVSVENYNRLVEEHNSLGKKHHALVKAYKDKEAAFNRGTGEVNKEIEQRKQQVELIQKGGQEEFEQYQNWLKNDGSGQLFVELNQHYALLVQKAKQSEKNRQRQEPDIGKVRELREIIGAHAKNEQDLIEDGALIVQVLLCGHEKSYMTIETGSNVVSLTPEMVKILQIEEHVGEEIEIVLPDRIKIKAPQLLIPSISYESHEAKFVKAVVLKQNIPGVDGGLGLSFLKRFNFRIEGKNPKKLILQQEAKSQLNGGFDIFISYKTSDLNFAQKVYDLLLQSGYKSFLADISLKGLPTNEFDKEIDKALESVKHFIVVCSSPENVKSGWVEREWRLFDALKMSDPKKGNIIPIRCGDMTIEGLPIALRRYQTVSMNELGWETTLLNYCR